MCVSLFLSSLFCSIDLSILYTNTILPWWLQLCNIVWNHGVYASSFVIFIFLTIAVAIWVGFSLLLLFFCGSIQILGLFVWFLLKIIGISIWISLQLQLSLGSINILTIFILLIHEHGISFHLFVPFSIFSLMFYSF